MDLRHIRYFVAVAEELNFTRAAARLGIGQPPLSQQIKDLEEELGVILLRRVPQGAELAEAGSIFLETGREALAAAERASTAAKRAARGEDGRLPVGFTSSAHFNELVPAIIRDFGRRFPDVELQLDESNTHILAQRVARETVDVAFTHESEQDDPNLDIVSVARERFVAVLQRKSSDGEPDALRAFRSRWRSIHSQAARDRAAAVCGGVRIVPPGWLRTELGPAGTSTCDSD